MDTKDVFLLASGIDDLIRVRDQQLPLLEEKRVRPTTFSREKMFGNMTHGRLSLFNNLPVSFKKEMDTAGLANAIRYGFPKVDRVRTQNGLARIRKYITIDALMNKWQHDKAIVSVTDLHFRKTLFERQVASSALSEFNIYCHNQELIDHLEMMTMVISTSGNVTDTHSDDSDGTNHCFTGRKLWLVWDRLEGKKQGLQDVSHDDIYERANFSIGAFLRTAGSQWFTIGPGETLFLPGNLTHRVITLESYIGIGSFYVTLPAYLRSLYRWTMIASTDVTPGLLQVISKEVVKRINALRSAGEEKQLQYGYDYLNIALQRFRKFLPEVHREAFWNHPFAKAYKEAIAGRQPILSTPDPAVGRLFEQKL